MKYVVVLGDGMADLPLPELEQKTPLAYATTPMMDELAKKSEIGMVHTVPDGMSPGSDTANLSVLGYDPKRYYSGRSPLEALSIGVQMKDTDVALRCNLVTLSEEDVPYEERTIVDHSSGEISTEDAAVLAVSSTLILPLVLYQLGDATQVTFANALRGTSHVMPMLWIAFFSYIVLGLPSTYVLAFPMGLGLWGIVLSFSLSLFTAGGLFFYFFRRATRPHSRV